MYTETLERNSTNGFIKYSRSPIKDNREKQRESIFATKFLEVLTCEPSNLELWTDSSSARAISQRLGPGRRATQLEVQTVWVTANVEARHPESTQSC